MCNETWQYCADSCAGSSREQRVVERREQEVVQAADVRCNYGVIGFDEPLGRSVQEADLRFGKAGLSREQVDTGALILTGVALLRHNARLIADLFAEEAGRFVAVSAGDNLEATMAANSTTSTSAR